MRILTSRPAADCVHICTRPACFVSVLTRVFANVCSAIGQGQQMFALSARQITVISTLLCSVFFCLASQAKNQACSLLYFVSLGFASVLYTRAAIFFRGALKGSLNMACDESDSSKQLQAAYTRTAVMVNRVLIYIACTVVTVPAYAMLVPEARATGLGMRPSLPYVFALLAIKVEFGVIVAVIAAYCVGPYRLRVAQASLRRSTTTITPVRSSKTT
jgi:hypothetical protein